MNTNGAGWPRVALALSHRANGAVKRVVTTVLVVAAAAVAGHFAPYAVTFVGMGMTDDAPTRAWFADRHNAALLAYGSRVMTIVFAAVAFGAFGFGPWLAAMRRSIALSPGTRLGLIVLGIFLGWIVFPIFAMIIAVLTAPGAIVALIRLFGDIAALPFALLPGGNRWLAAQALPAAAMRARYDASRGRD